MYWSFLPVCYALFQLFLGIIFSMVALSHFNAIMVKSILFLNISVFPHQIECFKDAGHLSVFDM